MAGAGAIELRDYQESAVEAALAQLQTADSTLGVAATGLGKTVIIAAVIRRWLAMRNGRVIVVVPSIALVDQTRDSLSSFLRQDVGVEQGKRSEQARGQLWRSRVVVACIGSISKLGRLQGYRDDEASLVVIDEGHHGPAATYRRVAGYFANAKRLYVTATPNRTDKTGLSTVCQTQAFQYDLPWGVNEGWLVFPRGRNIRVRGINFKNLDRRGDYSADDIAAAYGVGDDGRETFLRAVADEDGPLHEAARPVVELSKGRSGLVFAANRAHAKAMSEVMRVYGASTGVIIQETPAAERERLISQYRSGHLQWLVGCTALAEGFDAPVTQVVAILRQTKSLSFLTQMIGRSTRTLPGVLRPGMSRDERLAAIASSPKPQALVLSCCGFGGNTASMTIVDALGSDLPIDMRAEVLAEIEAADQEFDPFEVLSEISRRQEEAEQRRAKEAEATREDRARRIAQEWAEQVRQQQRRRVVAEVAYDTEEVDLLGGDNEFRANLMATGRRGTITDPQMHALATLGVARDESMTWSRERATRELTSRIGNGGDYVIPFGKFKGKRVREVPTWWFDWAREKLAPGRGRDRILDNYELWRIASGKAK